MVSPNPFPLAARAFKQAMVTLTALKAHPPQHIFDTTPVTGIGHSKSVFSSFVPSFQGRGPISSIIRILLRLHQITVGRVSDVLIEKTLGLGSERKEEELRGKAIKVVDLLQHSAELGNMDALFTLAQVSLVRRHEILFRRVISPFQP